MRDVPEVLALVGGRGVREVMGSVLGVVSSFAVCGVCDCEGRLVVNGEVLEEGVRRS